MFKRDPIFWWASGIFILALVLFALTEIDTYLTLMVLAYLLRPTLASLGMAKKYVDERQMSLNYRSGNIAFFVMMIACVFFSAKLKAENSSLKERLEKIEQQNMHHQELVNTLQNDRTVMHERVTGMISKIEDWEQSLYPAENSTDLADDGATENKAAASSDQTFSLAAE